MLLTRLREQIPAFHPAGVHVDFTLFRSANSVCRAGMLVHHGGIGTAPSPGGRGATPCHADAHDQPDNAAIGAVGAGEAGAAAISD